MPLLMVYNIPQTVKVKLDVSTMLQAGLTKERSWDSRTVRTTWTGSGR